MGAIQQLVEVFSERGSANKFSTYINIPSAPNVQVQVLEVKTSLDIKLLPHSEDPFILFFTLSSNDRFEQQSDFHFITLNISDFTLNQSYDDMFARCLTPLDFTLPYWRDLLNNAKYGAPWFALLERHFFNNIKWFTETSFFVFRTRVEQSIVNIEQVGYYNVVLNSIGPFFLSLKKTDNFRATDFLKWLWKRGHWTLRNTKMDLSSNLPINSQLKVTNKSRKHLRFEVAEMNIDHSMYSLFQTLPDIAPYERGISSGTLFLPKEPFDILYMHSNLCTASAIGNGTDELLCTVFTGDKIEGFKRQGHLPQLPLRLNPGYQEVSFEIRTKGYNRELEYSDAKNSMSKIKLAFIY